MVTQRAGLKDVKEVINELTQMNSRLERLLEQIPTSDDRILAELNILFNRQTQLINTQTTKERGTILLEQAKGKGTTLKERYTMLLNKGLLRKRK